MEQNGENLFDQNMLNPREFMRARHPDLFSDTKVDVYSRVPKEVFEYHLETLTNRKQEYEFEHLCRKIAEKEICPNLRTQTGPTGGGDSKVDAETYPVAEEIAERWWIGSPNSAKERWAFAFSAKRDWKSKFKADVDSILSTGRGYQRIYFFTNQFVRDKERANQEDTVSQKAGVPIHIFDRAWIVDKVYNANHLEMAIVTLGIEGATTEKTAHLGPIDTLRHEKLEKLDQQIKDVSRYQGSRYQLVEDCLRGAILARGLSRDRNEIEGRFVQTERLSKTLNYRPQRLRIAYNRAWTAYWWDENFASFNTFYEEVENFIQGSTEMVEIELLVNLWLLLPTAVSKQWTCSENAELEPRGQRLLAILGTMMADSSRPNNALQARTSWTIVKALLDNLIKQTGKLEAVWSDLEQIVGDSIGLGSYPLVRLFDIIKELGKYYDGPAFDSLYRKLVDTMCERRSDGEAGKAYAQRARQKLQQEKPYEAIQWFGQAERLLIKDEYLGELIEVLIHSSSAYEHAGLLWAARNKVLTAADRSLKKFAEGEMTFEAFTALNRLSWIELQLGRIPHFLSVISFLRPLACNLNLSQEGQSTYAKECLQQDLVLGMHMLNIPFNALLNVKRLPDLLKQQEFYYARLALLFVFGHERALRNEGAIPESENTNAIQTLFERWQDQPAANDIPSQPILVNGATSSLQSTILGCDFIVETPNNTISFGIAESLLGALEVFLSTADEADIIPYRERMKIVVKASESHSGVPRLHLPDDDSHAKVIHSGCWWLLSISDHKEYIKWLQDSIMRILPRVFHIRDVTDWIKKHVGQEHSLDRALIFGDILTLNKNIFGEISKICIADWLDENSQTYSVLRTKPWREINCKSFDNSEKSIKLGSNSSSEETFRKENLKHTDRRALSPIDIDLWDKAKWKATAFLTGSNILPVLSIVFENGTVGQRIFSSWREQWGEEDKDNTLRVAIVTGISKSNPADYIVSIGPNISEKLERSKKLFSTVSRINRMAAVNSINLDRFIDEYKKTEKFHLMPAQMGKTEPTFFPHFRILKQHFVIREAWQISENDPDIVVLPEVDDPIIPSEVNDPPISKALTKIMRKKISASNYF